MSESLSKRRSRTEWERLMGHYEQSELTQRAFCTQHELAYSSFCYWRKRLRTPSAGATPTLIELPVEPAEATPSWRIEIDLGEGVVLRLR